LTACQRIAVFIEELHAIFLIALTRLGIVTISSGQRISLGVFQWTPSHFSAVAAIAGR
jgi:hypothetical protein